MVYSIDIRKYVYIVYMQIYLQVYMYVFSSIIYLDQQHVRLFNYQVLCVLHAKSEFMQVKLSAS